MLRHIYDHMESLFHRLYRLPLEMHILPSKLPSDTTWHLQRFVISEGVKIHEKKFLHIVTLCMLYCKFCLYCIMPFHLLWYQYFNVICYRFKNNQSNAMSASWIPVVDPIKLLNKRTTLSLLNCIFYSSQCKQNAPYFSWCKQNAHLKIYWYKCHP